MSTALGGLNTSGLYNLANSVKRLSSAVQAMSGVKTSDFTRLARNISTLASVNTTNLYQISNVLRNFTNSINKMGAITFDATQLANLGNGISKLGGVNIQRAITNMPLLANGLTNMMKTLSTAPRVSRNLIDMTNALARLSAQGNKLGNAANSIRGGLNNYNTGAKSAIKSTTSLSSSFMMLYAKLYMMKRVLTGFWKIVKKSMDYVETLNYFNVAFNQIGKDSISKWEELGYESAEAYVDSFSARAKELTAKLTGFSIKDDGTMVEAGIKNVGLDPDMIMNYQAQFAQMANSMGLVTDSAMNVSQALTMLGADWASLKNLKMDVAYTKMASALTGQVKPARELGIDLTMATLQTYAYQYGLEGAVSQMSQATKVQLRMIAMLDQSRVAFGDMARTISQPANQVRLLQQNFANLARAIGNVFLPVVAKILPYLNGMVIALRRLFTWIGMILGFKMGDFSSSIGGAGDGIGDIEDGMDGVTDSTNGATNAAKKLKSVMLGIDELNVIDQGDGSAGGGTGGGGAGSAGNPMLDAALSEALAKYQKEWDDAFSQMENKAETFAKSVEGAFKKIWEAAEPTRKAIKKLWEEGFAKLGEFTWTAIKDFYEGFLVPMGKWMLGDEGLARFFNITNDLLKNIDWSRLNTSLSDFFTELQKPTKFVFTALLDFYEGFLKPITSWTIGEGLPRLLDVCSKLVSSINWTLLNDGLKVLWEALGPFAVAVGSGLVSFIEALSGILTPFIAFTIDSMSLALKVFAGIINAIPPEALQVLGGALGGLFTTILAYKAVAGIVTLVKGITLAFETMLVTLAANPIMIIVGALAMLAGAFMEVSNSYDRKLAEEYQKFVDTMSPSTQIIREHTGELQEFIKKSGEITEAAKAEGAGLDILKEKYFELADKVNLTQKEQKLLQYYGDQLVQKVPSLAGAIDTTTGKYTGQKDEIIKLIDAQKDYQMSLAYGKILEEYNVQLAQASINLKKNQEETDSLQKAHDGLLKKKEELTNSDLEVWKIEELLGMTLEETRDTLYDYTKTIEENGNAQEAYKKEIAELETQMGYVTDALADSRIAFENTQQAAENIKFADVSIKAANAIDGTHGIWRDGAQVLGQDAVNIYNEIMAGLEPLKDGTYKLADGSIVAFGDALGKGKEDIVSTADDVFITSLQGMLPEGYTIAKDAGGNVAIGFKEGIEGEQDSTFDIVKSWQSNISSGITDFWDINSPSKVANGYGGYVVDGFNDGIEDNQESSCGFITSWVQGIASWFTQGLDDNIPNSEPYGQTILQDITDGFKNTFGEWTTSLNDWYTNHISVWFTSQKWSELYNTIKIELSKKWNETVGVWGTSISNWWSINVSPWFTIDKWSNLYQAIKTQLKDTWDNTVGSWVKGVTNWWDNNVSPWFTANKWINLYETVRTQLKDTWDNTVGNWQQDLSSWWDNDVAVWFTSNTWSDLYDSIKSGLSAKWGETLEDWQTNIKSWWDNDVAVWFTAEKWTKIMSGVGEGFSKTFKNAVNGAVAIFNKFIDWLNKNMCFEWDAFEIMGQEIIPSGSLQLFTIPRIPQLADGGIVNSGQLFIANEAGPELVGSLNGKTGVINNKQIVDAVSQGVASAVAGVLGSMQHNQDNNSPQQINLVVDGRTLAKVVTDANRRSGFNFRMV